MSLLSRSRHFMMVIAGCLLLSQTAHPAQEFYPFQSPELRDRFASLTSELRCLVCQNETLAESHATLATDLRAEIYQRMQSGQSNQQIVDYLVSRYGNFILYRPPLTQATVALWFGPFFFLGAGMAVLFWKIRSSRRRDP